MLITKNKLTFVLPEALQKELKERIIKDNYGLRGKSRWVAEAIKCLLDMENYPELVNLNDELKKLTKIESIIVTDSIKNKINLTTVVIRKKFPILEGVQSRIIRTAIIQRLLR